MADDNIIEVRFIGQSEGLEQAADSASHAIKEVDASTAKSTETTVKATKATVDNTRATIDWSKSLMDGKKATVDTAEAVDNKMTPALTKAEQALEVIVQTTGLSVAALGGLAAGALALGGVLVMVAMHLKKMADEQHALNIAMASGEIGRMTGKLREYRKELEELAAMKAPEQSWEEQLAFGGAANPLSASQMHRQRDIMGLVTQTFKAISDRETAIYIAKQSGHEYQQAPGVIDAARGRNLAQRLAVQTRSQTTAMGLAAGLPGQQAAVLQAEAALLKVRGDSAGALEKQLRALDLQAQGARQLLDFQVKTGQMSEQEATMRERVLGITTSQLKVQRELLVARDAETKKQERFAAISTTGGAIGQYTDAQTAAFETWLSAKRAFETDPSGDSAKKLAEASMSPYLAGETAVEAALDVAWRIATVREAYGLQQLAEREQDRLHEEMEQARGKRERGAHVVLSGEETSRRNLERSIHRSLAEAGLDTSKAPELARQRFGATRTSLEEELEFGALNESQRALSVAERRAFAGRQYAQAALSFKTRNPAEEMGVQMAAGFELGASRAVDQMGTWGENMTRAITNVASNMAQTFDDMFFSVVTGEFARLPDIARNMGAQVLREITGLFTRAAVRSMMAPLQGAMMGGAAPVGMLAGAGGAGIEGSLGAGGVTAAGGGGSFMAGVENLFGGIGGYVQSGLGFIGSGISSLFGGGSAIAGGTGMWAAYPSTAATFGESAGTAIYSTAGSGVSYLGGAVGALGLGMSVYGAVTAQTPMQGALAGVAAGVSTYGMVSAMAPMLASMWGAAGASSVPTLGISLVVAAVVTAIGTIFGFGSQAKKGRAVRIQRNLERQAAVITALIQEAANMTAEEAQGLLDHITIGMPLPAGTERLYALMQVDLRPGIGDVARQQPHLLTQLAEALRRRIAYLTNEAEGTFFNVGVEDLPRPGITRRTELSIRATDMEKRLAQARSRSSFGQLLTSIDDQTSEYLLKKLLGTASRLDLRLLPTPRWSVET